MAHAHDHHHDASAYYTEQLCTIAFCGAFGGIAVALYASGLLKNILAQGILQESLLAGGIILLVLVFIRAVALWQSVGRPAPNHEHHHHDYDHDCCDHDHAHEHAVTDAGHEHHHHNPDHSHERHSHEHDHDHGWAPIRYVVLAVPIVLYFFVPLDALSSAHGYGGVIDPAWMKMVQATGDEGELGFGELTNAANDENRRKYYDGKIARLKGQFVPSANDHVFSLMRLKIRCCAADAVPLGSPVIINDSLAKELPAEQRVPNSAGLNRKWVEITCQIQFRQRPDKPNEWIAVLAVQPTKDKPITDLVKPTDPDPNPYLY